MSFGTVRTFAGALLLLLLVATLGACRPAQAVRPGMTDIRVNQVRIRGNDAFPEDQILDVLATQENTWTPFAPVATYNRFDVATDMQRIETFYHARGYFDARVVDHEVDIYDARRDRQKARVVFTVEEGEASFLRRDAVYHVDSLRAVEDVRALVEDSRLRQGARFSQVDVEAERNRLRRALQERSYARARVEARVYVNREQREVEVYFFFDPGVSCVFGEITVEGNVNIPDDLIINAIPIEEGTAYRQSLLRLSQVELYDMDAFTSVDVSVDLSLGDDAQPAEARLPAIAAHDAEMAARGFEALREPVPDVPSGPRVAQLFERRDEIDRVEPEIPVTITVSESAPASYKGGGGFGIETSRTQAYGRANAVWRNVLAPLNRAEIDGRLGYAWLPTLFTREPFPTGIIGEVEVGLSRPKLLLGIFDVSMRVGYEHGLEPDHAFDRPSVRLGVSNRIGEFVRFSTSYKVSLNYTRDFANAENIVRENVSCERLPRAFRLGHLDVEIASDRRDPNLVDGNADWAATLNTQLGEGLIGEFPYVRVQPDVRYYQPITRRLSLNARLAGGVIFDYGEPVPRSQCLFLGGGNDVRAYPARRVGPHVEPNIPNGGVTSVVFNFEPRLVLSDLFGLAAFFDAGTVNPRLSIDPSWGGATGIHAGAGAGLRVYTPIGPFRLDIAARITEPASNAGRVRRVGFVLSLGEAF